jgi:hypothetical protein
VLVIENDSSDDTRGLLKAWQHANDHVKLIKCASNPDCVFGAPDGSELEVHGKQRVRMRNMARFRNFYLKELRNMADKWTHVMVIDFDCQGSVDLDGMRAVMKEEHRWDVCSCNGRMAFPPLYLVKRPYDTMAFVDNDTDPNTQFSDDLLQRQVRHTRFYEKHVRAHENKVIGAGRLFLAPVYSAFNGCALYQRKALNNAHYISIDADRVGCEHVGLHADMHTQGFRRHFLCPQWKVFMGAQGNANLIAGALNHSS